MVANLAIGLFMEDNAHERFTKSLIEKIASEIGLSVTFDVMNASGGIPRMRRELRRFLSQRVRASYDSPDVLVIVQDTDCRGEMVVKREIHSIIQRSGYLGTAIVGTPAPHIEGWYLADPVAIQNVSGSSKLAPTPSGECVKGLYKNQLLNEFPNEPLGGIARAVDIVSAMDLYRAGRNAPSLRNFINDLKSTLNQLGDSQQ